MPKLYFSHKLFFVIGLILIATSGCRKDIDYDQADFTATGQLNPSQPILEEWEQVAGISGVLNIESDGNLIYFNRIVGTSNDMYSLDTSGNVVTLFNIGNADDVTLLKREAQKMYFCQSVSSSLLTVNEFEPTGVQNVYSLNVTSMQGARINDVIDLGPEFLVTGSYFISTAFPSPRYACLIDKATGDSIPMPGLISVNPNGIEDAIVFNNEIYVVGTYLTVSPSRSMAKWNGTEFVAIGNTSGAVNSIAEVNGELVVGGDIGGSQATGLSKFNLATETYEANPLFTLGNEGFNQVSVKFKEYNGKQYCFGTIGLASSSMRSVYEFNNGSWSSIGALDMTASDFTVCQGYAYVLVNGELFRYKL